ncbi:MAG: hypothetical protein ACYC2I_06535 [Elusimicrobiales bacterium]
MKILRLTTSGAFFRALSRFAAAAALAVLCASPAPAQKAAGQPGARLDLYLEPLDGQGWQWFFIADTVRRRLAAAELKVYPLVAKDAKGAFTARRGEAEVAEAERIALVSQKYPARLPDYLNARSMSPAADGWRDAALFAGINPDVLENLAASEGVEALENAYKAVAAAGASESSLYLGGKRYEKAPRLMPLYEAVNAALPADRRIPPPAGYKPRPKPAPPGFWVVLGSGTPLNTGLVGAFDRYFEGIKPEVLDYDAPGRDGKFPELKYVPAYLLAATPAAKKKLARELEAGLFTERGGYLVYEDRSGGGTFTSRAVKKDTLELFVMSQCPYGVAAENALLEAGRKDLLPAGLKVETHYIGEAVVKSTGGWEFSSLHGQPEWEENARQLYIAAKFPDRFDAYLLERNKDVKSGDWKKAAEAAGVPVDAVTAGEEEGKRLLAADFAATSELGISSSPSFILDGKRLVSGLGELARQPGFEKVPLSAQPAGAACNK